MSNQKLGILAVVAVVMVLWAIVQSRISNRQEAAAPSTPAYLIQGLNPDEIASIVIGHGDDAVKIERQDAGFVVVNKSNYPADPKQINDLITKALDIKTTELYTDKAANHKELEVTEDNAKHLIKFFKADGSLLTGVIVGKSQETGGSTFVRQAGSDAVYLAENAPWFRSTPLDYVNQEITSVKREDVNSVTVSTPEGTYTLRPKKDGDGVVMENLPAGKKLKESDAKSVFGALTSLRFEDVNAPGDVPDLNFDRTYVCRLDDSTEYRLSLAKKGAKTYLKCEAEYTDKTPVRKKLNEVESDEQLKKKEAKLLADEHAQKFTLRHKAWVYEIADWKAKYLTENGSALLEDVEKAKPAEKTQEQPPVQSSSPAVEPNQPQKAEPVVEPNVAAPAPTTGAAATVEPNATTAAPAAEPNATPGR